MSVAKRPLLFLLIAMLSANAQAADFFVGLSGEFSVERLVLPKEAKLIKTLHNLELFIVRSSKADLKVENAKIIFKRSFQTVEKYSQADEMALNKKNTERDSEERIVGPYPWGVAKVNAPQVWRRGFTGAGVKVLLLDSGYVKDHPALHGVIKEARDYTDSKVSLGVPYPEYDITGHATHIAGTIAGNGFNGLHGVAPDVELYVGKVCVFICQKVDGMVEALEWGIQRGVRVVSMSYTVGTKSDWTALGNHIFSRLEDLNVLAVSSSGNSGLKNGKIQFPANQPTVMAVGATDYSGEVSDFSTRGAVLSVVAPGEDVVSASLLKGINSTPTLLSIKSGTSMAVPHVTGVASLLIGAYPQAKVSKIREVIERGAVKFPKVFDEVYGHGEVDAEASLNLLGSLN